MKLAAVAVPRLDPVIVTAVPSIPLVGEKDVISGVTDVVMRPIVLLPLLVNHSAPPGPEVISTGSLIPVPV